MANEITHQFERLLALKREGRADADQLRLLDALWRMLTPEQRHHYNLQEGTPEATQGEARRITKVRILSQEETLENLRRELEGKLVLVKYETGEGAGWDERTVVGYLVRVAVATGHLWVSNQHSRLQDRCLASVEVVIAWREVSYLRQLQEVGDGPG